MNMETTEIELIQDCRDVFCVFVLLHFAPIAASVTLVIFLICKNEQDSNCDD